MGLKESCFHEKKYKKTFVQNGFKTESEVCSRCGEEVERRIVSLVDMYTSIKEPISREWSRKWHGIRVTGKEQNW